MGVFSSKAVPSSMQNELKARASVQAVDSWFASRVNWVHVMSFCDGCSSNVKQIHSFRYLNMYQDGGTFSGKRPTPVIESVTVKALGNLGTTRSCTIKMIAFTQAQLNELTACYGIPSMSVRVQFGWNKGANGTPAPGVLTGVRTDNETINAINDLRSTFANYDGLQGIVGKWSINFVKESMWWEFNLEIIAASAPVLSRPLEDFTSQCYCDRVSQTPEGETEKVSQGTSVLRAQLVQYIEKPDSKDAGVYQIQLNHSERDQLGAYSGGLMGKLAAKIGITSSTKEAYITFGKLQQIVNDYSFTQANNEPLMVKIDSTTYGTISFKAPGYTSDPDICIFPGIDVPHEGGLNGIANAPTCKVEDGVDINKVLLNCIFLNKCIEDIGKQGTLQDFFEKVFNGMNQASGGTYELSLIDTGGDVKSKVPIITAIDLQKFKKVVAVTNLPVDPQSAVVRDVKLDLKLTDAMKSQALYAGVRKNSNSSACDEARFKNELEGSINLTLPSPTSPPKDDCPSECKTKEEHEKEKSLDDDYKDMLADTNDVSKETIRARLVEKYNENAEKDLCKEVIVPYEFSFTVDGIGGFAFGQLVTCDLLPEKIKSTYVYQITSVEHNVVYGDWTTTVNTVARYK